MIKAEVIQHTVCPGHKPWFTLQVEYPRIIHSEAKTHRIIRLGNEEYELTLPHAFMDDPFLSRNAMSSRAVPVAKMIEQVRKDPFVPLEWGSNQAGMQAGAEISPARQEEAEYEWRRAAEHAAYFAERLHGLGLHKQIVNRVLEPYQWMRTVVSGTEWDNFFALRDHPAAEPHFQRLARAMKEAMAKSEPVLRGTDNTDVNNWHLPYVHDFERQTVADRGLDGALFLARLSAARCARVSYLRHDGKTPDANEDIELFKRLAGSHPMHASPLEHAGFASEHVDVMFANLKGYINLRWIMEREPIVERVGEEQLAE